MNEISNYLQKIFTSLEPKVIASWTIVWGIVSYLAFPEASYQTAATAVLVMIVLDIITKYYALARANNGLFNAFKVGAISSNSFFKGSAKKLVTFMILAIMAGLSYRVQPIGGVSLVMASVVYSIMFLRECQSILENLRDAGHDGLEWFLIFLKRKEKKILGEGEQGSDAIEQIKSNPDYYEELLQSIDQVNKGKNNTPTI
jgi:phage-related holin